MIAIAGQRDALTALLLERMGAPAMPGCLRSITATDPGDSDALWSTEVWESQAHHEASLALPTVQQAIARGRPLIAGCGERFETAPVGGYGLVPATGA